MKKRSLIILFGALVACGYAGAQDKSTLDLLVSKGVITREEADKLSKGETAVYSTPANKGTKKFVVSGLVQTQYQWINSRASEPLGESAPGKNGFVARRLFLGMEGDLGSGFSANIIADFAASGPKDAQYLNVAYLSKKIDGEYINGSLSAGYRKVNFALEENTSATRLLAIERSLASRYFTDQQKQGSGNLGFGSRYTGMFWNGNVKQVEGLSYGMALTNSQNYSIRLQSNDDTYDNTLNMWTNVVYKNKLDISGEKIDYRAGLNFGYGNGANSRLNGGSSSGEIWGVNPYVEVKWRGLSIYSDFLMAGVENGRRNGTEDATPYGVNLGMEYRFDIEEWGAIAPAFRYSYLGTNGRGANIADAMSGAPNVDSTSNPNNLYNSAQSFYLGLNWYIIGDAVKLQAGYEWARFEGNIDPMSTEGKKADVNAFRMQMQVIF